MNNKCETQVATEPLTVAQVLAEFDKRAVPDVGFYEPHEPAEIIREMLAASSAPPAAPEPLSAAARDVLAERRRQIEAEGWTPEHDDEHSRGELAQAAAFYALYGLGYEAGRVVWPWHPDWMKAGDTRRSLVKSSSLLLAEIERLDRAQRQT